MSLFLFVCKDCDFSKKFIGLISKYWRHNDIKYVVIDDLDNKEIPNYITKTPSILRLHNSGESELFEGQVAFDWLRDTVVKLYKPAEQIKSVKDKDTYNTEPSRDINDFEQQTKKGEFTAINIKDEKDFTGEGDVMKLFEERSKMYENEV